MVRAAICQESFPKSLQCAWSLGIVTLPDPTPGIQEAIKASTSSQRKTPSVAIDNPVFLGLVACLGAWILHFILFPKCHAFSFAVPSASNCLPGHWPNAPFRPSFSIPPLYGNQALVLEQTQIFSAVYSHLCVFPPLVSSHRL